MPAPLPIASGIPSIDAPRRLDLALVGALALGVRMAVILAVPLSAPFSDMTDYHVRAEMLLHEGRLYPDSWRGPGYPLFLALAYVWPGNDLLAARIGHAALGGVSAALTVLLASVFVRRRAAIASGAIVALYPGLVLSSVYLLSETLYVCQMLAVLVLAMRLDAWRGAAAGVVTGWAMLTRSMGLALGPAITIGSLVHAWSFDRDHRAAAVREAIPGVAAVVTACLLTLAPWLWRTAAVSGAPMLDSASACNVLVGSNPRSTGRLEIADAYWVMDTLLAGSTSEANRSRRAIEQSVAWIGANPGDWLRLIPIKIGYVWGLEGREHAWLYSVSYLGAQAPSTVWGWGVLLLASFPLLAVPAVVGLLRPGLARHPSGLHIALLIAIVTMLHAFSFGESRFHLPLIPVLAVLAARGVAATDAPLTRVRLGVCVLLVLALAIAWASQAPELVARLNELAAPDGWQRWLPY